MTIKETAVLAQVQDFGYNHNMVRTSLQLLGQSHKVVEDTLLYLYNNHPSEKAFIEYIILPICARVNKEI